MLLTTLQSFLSFSYLFTYLHCLQLLKAVFGTNLCGQWDSHVSATALSKPVSRRSSSRTGSSSPASSARLGIYHVCLNQPYIQLTQAMANTTMRLHTPAQTPGTMSSATSVEHDDSSSRSVMCESSRTWHQLWGFLKTKNSGLGLGLCFK